MAYPWGKSLWFASNRTLAGHWRCSGGANLVPANNGTTNSRSFSLLPSHYCVPAVLSCCSDVCMGYFLKEGGWALEVVWGANLVPANNGTTNSRSFSLLPSHYCGPAVLSCCSDVCMRYYLYCFFYQYKISCQ